MSYFNHFDRVQYNGQETVNILNSVIARYRAIRESSLYYYYTLLDGEMPEDVSYKMYGNVKYWWILVMINNVVDPYHDWLMSPRTLESFAHDKYGDDVLKVHHFENLTTNRNSDGYDSVIYQTLLDNGDEVPHNIQAVSNMEYETIENEKNRSIKVISEMYIQDIQDNFEDLMDDRRLAGL